MLHVLAKDLDPHKVPVADDCTHDPTVATPTEPLDAALQRIAERRCGDFRWSTTDAS